MDNKTCNFSFCEYKNVLLMPLHRVYSDGATRSGLLCDVSYMVEQLKVEQEVDELQIVKHTRISRPQLIPTYVCPLS